MSPNERVTSTRLAYIWSQSAGKGMFRVAMIVMGWSGIEITAILTHLTHIQSYSIMTTNMTISTTINENQYLHKGNPTKKGGSQAESRICLPHRSTCQSCRSNGKVRPTRLPKRALGVNSPGRPRKRMSLGSLHSSSCKRSYLRISLIDLKFISSSLKQFNSCHQVGKWTRFMLPGFNNSITNIRHTHGVLAK